MPNDFAIRALRKLGAQIPETVEVSPEQRALHEELAKREQAKWSPTSRAVNTGIEAVPQFLKGLVTSDPNMPRAAFDQTSGAERLGMLGAAAPLGFKQLGTGIRGLYSRVNKTIDAFPGKQINANRALNLLGNKASAEEIGYTGIKSFLKGSAGKSVSVDSLKDIATQKPLQVKVKRYGDANPGNVSMEDWFYRHYGRRARDIDLKDPSVVSTWEQVNTNEPTRFSRYTLPGGENYREQVIQLDTSPQYSGVNAELNDLLDVPVSDLSEAQALALRNADESGQIIRSQQEPFRHDGHWPGVDNPIAHVRHNERKMHTELPEGFSVQPGEDFRASGNGLSYWVSGRQTDPTNTIRGWNQYMEPSGSSKAEAIQKAMEQDLGPKGRFLEEIQSDWHEQGRDHGYRIPAVEFERQLEEARAKAAQAEAARLAYVHANPKIIGHAALGQYPELDRLWETRVLRETDLNNLLRQYRKQVPDAPFKEDWPDLALKQQLLEVAERPDLDWLGFTTGQTQIDRYDLSQVANRIYYDQQQRVLEVLDNEGSHVATYVVEKPEDLIPLIGKDAADRLMRNPLPGTEFPQAMSGPIYELAGEDLQIGGAGMTEFYDKQLPRKLEKILAPFGGKVEKGSLGPLMKPGGYSQPENDKAVEMWYAKLSPEMKAAIREKGLPLLMALLGVELGNEHTIENEYATLAH